MVVAVFLPIRNQIRHQMSQKTALQTAMSIVHRYSNSLFDEHSARGRQFINEMNECLEFERQQIIEAHGIKREHDIQNGVDFWKIKHGEQYYIEKFGDHIVDVTKMIKPQQP